MNKFSSIKKLFYIFFTAFLLTCIITFYYNFSVKDRFFKQIKISSNHLNESVLISYLKSKIGIGTLQWGLKYGIANKKGKLSNQEIKKIKHLAKKK